MSRKERTLKNGISGIVKYFVKLVLQFILRTLIIYKLGVEFVGLDSLYANIISILSLAELGMGSALVYSMYKPAAEKDYEKLKRLNNFYRKVYTIISIIVLTIGLGIMPFLEFFIKGNPNIDVNIYIVYVVFLLNTVVSYLGAHKRALLFVFQRNDVETNIITTQIIALSVAQSIMLLAFRSYYLYVIMIPIFTLFEVVSVVAITRKKYPEISGKAEKLDKETKKVITKNIIATSCHQLGSVVVLSTDNLLVSKFFGLTALGTISNYILIYNAVNSLLLIIIEALKASVGNLIATTDTEKVYKFFNLINWLFSCLVGFCSIALLCLYKPFINLWVGDTGYIITFGVILTLVIKFYTTKMRNVVNMFKDCAGLMWNDRFKPLAEAFINLTASIACIYLFGLAGIYIGTIISTLFVPLWVEPLVLFKNYFKKPLKEYFKKYLLYTTVTLIVGGVTYLLCYIIKLQGIIGLIAMATICLVVPIILYYIAYFRTNQFKDLKSKAYGFIKSGKEKNNT